MISREHFYRTWKNFRYCTTPEKIENYEAAMSDTTNIWVCHHRLESDYTKNELIELGLYYNRPPEELIFLTDAEHKKLPHKGKKVQGKKIGKGQSKKVLCVETNTVYESIKTAAEQTGANDTHISNVCLGKRKTSGGYHWKFYEEKLA